MGTFRRSVLLVCLSLSLFSIESARPAHADAQPLPPREQIQQSPRASLGKFLNHCRDGNYSDAATYLVLDEGHRDQGPKIAERLGVVLDAYLWIDLEEISDEVGGDRDDGLSSRVEQVGEIPTKDGKREPVRMAYDASSGRWKFTRSTIGRVDGWFGGLRHGWLVEHLPPALLVPGPRGLLYWQWIALPLLLLVAIPLGIFLSRVTRWFLSRIVRRTASTWDDELLKRYHSPVTTIWAIVAVYALVPFVQLLSPAEQFIHRVLQVGFYFVFFWMMWRTIDVLRHATGQSRWVVNHLAFRALLPLTARVAKVAVFALGAIALLSQLGYPITSLVAGLGIGGLALALAAQKTVENLFGAFSIGADQPFVEGDFVKIEDFVGTVEAIGLRSTRIRTLDRTIITMPNGKLADMRLESFSVRDRMRLSTILGLVYETTPAQMRAVLEGLERVLRNHPKIWPDAVVVRFQSFGESSLNIEVMAWFQTADWSEFQLIRQDVLLQFMDVVKDEGSDFAFPTRTLHLASAPFAKSEIADIAKQ